MLTHDRLRRSSLALALSLGRSCRCAGWSPIRLGFVAQPREDRWHRRPVALFGGVGIAAVLFSAPRSFGSSPANCPC